MQPSTMFAFQEPFDPSFSDLFELGWPKLETPYGSFLETDVNGIRAQEPAFCSSDNLNVIDSMNNSMKSTKQRQVISTRLVLPLPPVSALPTPLNSSDTREVATLDTSLLSHPWAGGGIQTIYPPSNCSGVRRQQAPYPLPSTSTRLEAASTSVSTGCLRTRDVRRSYCSTQSRNPTATSEEVVEIMRMLKPGKGPGPPDLLCPVKRCTQKQVNGRRTPDFRRHLRTHLEKNGEICKGVPWEQLLYNHHLYPKISGDEQPYTVPEEDGLWIGGCLKTYSRSDALKRHLRTSSCTAVDRSRNIIPPLSENLVQ